MRWKNSSSHYGLVSIALHWVIAVTFFGMFILGLWMVDLSYGDAWYHDAPFIHKSIGVIVAITMVSRLLWRFYSRVPAALPSHTGLIRVLSGLGHIALYLGVFAIVTSGYLISTADGRPVSVFGWFEVPALISGLPGQADIAGMLHEYGAWTIVIMAVLHGVMAVKHHVIDKDSTLKRMLGRN